MTDKPHVTDAQLQAEVEKIMEVFSEALQALMDDQFVRPIVVIVAASDLIGTMIAADMVLEQRDEPTTYEEHMKGITALIKLAMNGALAKSRSG